jgi:adenosine deaminase
MAERGISAPWGGQIAGEWFAEQANKKSLPAYLESFQYTLACMQRPQDLTSVAREACLDLAVDNVQYAELRFCPLLSTRDGLSPDAVLDAVLEGIDSVRRSHGIHVQLLLCAMRQNDPADSLTVVELAKQYIGKGVAGVDLAGPEEGFLPSLHAKAFQRASEYGIPITIHAGEVCGMDSISSAINDGFAQRLGHGIRVVDGMGHEGQLPDLLWEILERNIILEVCPSSNVQTGAVSALNEHPWQILDRLGFPITLNTDNRLMGNTTTSMEWSLAASQYDFTLEDAQRHTATAIGGAFASEEVKKDLRANLKQWALEQGLEPLYDESIPSAGHNA